MKYVPNSVTRAVGRTVLKSRKNSPTILFVVGVGGIVTSTILACRATLKVDTTLSKHEQRMLEISRQGSNGMISDPQKARQKQLMYTAGNLCKLYAPAVVVGVGSLYCLTKSHRILTDRNTQLTAAYVGLQRFLEGYRGRVREKIGEDEERDVYYASTPVEIVEDTDKGPKKIFASAPGQKSPYSALFTDRNLNWQESSAFNINFFKIKEQLLTDKLRSQGSLMLNEVYDALDMPRTANGAICGWMMGHPDSDDFVEFDIIPLHDYHGTLMVDFNVAGVVYDMLSGLASGRSV